MNIKADKLIQLLLIILVVTGIVGFYFYINSTASTKINSSQETKLTDGLLGYWTFDGNHMDWSEVNEARDQSGNGNHGNVVSLTNSDATPGKIGQTLDFDGNNDYVDLGQPASLNTNSQLTISAWIYRKDINQDHVIITSFDSGEFPYEFRVEGGSYGTANTLSYYYDNGGGVLKAAGVGTLQANQWYHVAITNDGSNATIYINGSMDNSEAEGAPGTLENNIHIGYRASSFAPFEGMIDEVRIYNRALTASEISGLYQQGQVKINSNQDNKLTDGLVLYQSFDGNHMDWSQSSAEARDQAGTNHGNVYNDVSPVMGKVGQGMEFDGTTDYISTVSNINLGTTHSVSFWTKFNAVNRVFIGYTAQHYAPYLSGTLLYYGAGSGNACDITITNNTGQWYYLTITRTNTSIKFYRDGIYVDTCSIPSNDDFLFRTIGAYNGGSFSVDGIIDEVRIYNREIAATEIAELYNLGQAKVNASQETKLTEGLVGNWTFDGNHMDWSQASAEARDQIGSNHGDVSGATTAIGKVGQALDFNGTSDYVDIGSNMQFSKTQDFSVAAWVKPDTLSGNVIISSDQDGNMGWIFMFTSGGKVSARFAGTCCSTYDFYITANTNNTFNFNQWHHVVFTFDGHSGHVDASTNVKVYVNGSNEPHDSTQILDSWSEWSNATNARIGSRSNGNNYFPGSIDEARIYNRVITADEVSQLYMMGK